MIKSDDDVGDDDDDSDNICCKLGPVTPPFSETAMVVSPIFRHAK